MFVSKGEVILSIFLSQLFKLVSVDTWLLDCCMLQQGVNCLVCRPVNNSLKVLKLDGYLISGDKMID
jgi:hypothetical protein